MLEYDSIIKPACLRVVGVGGCGNNVVNNMVDAKLEGVEFISVNTDAQVLALSKAGTSVQIGAKLTRGRGAGAKPEVGMKAAEESLVDLENAIDGADLVFITAGMGGGTGTGAAPIIAKLAKDRGILTIGVVTKPFGWEGKERISHAEAGIEELKKAVDSLIIIPNSRLLEIADRNISLKQAWKMSDDMLIQGIRGISDLIFKPGDVNVDFADMRTVMLDKGIAHMGIGRHSGEDKVMRAVSAAIQNPLLETKIDGAKSLLINFSGDENLGLHEISKACEEINKKIDERCNFIFGTSINNEAKDEVFVTLIATGILEPQSSTASRRYNPDDLKRALPPQPVAPIQKSGSRLGAITDVTEEDEEPLKSFSQLDEPFVQIPPFLKRK